MPQTRLRVMINDRVLRGPRTGIGHYVAELVAALPSALPGIEVLPFYSTYIALRDRTPEPGSSSKTPHRRAFWLRNLAEKLYQRAFATVGRLRGYRLYHEPCHIPGPWRGPIVTTVHDLSVLRHPEWHPDDRVRWYQQEFIPNLPRSTHFITVSEFTRQEMIDLLDISPDRITSIHCGVRRIFHPRDAQDVHTYLSQYDLPPEYLLYVGTIEPRKNLARILAAYRQLSPALRSRYPLLIVGCAGWGRDDAEQLIKEHTLANDAHLLGYLGDEALALLYCGARALIWPTLYEGFGLPPAEAMASGTPVIVANRSSLPEVVGDAGIQVDPENTTAIHEAMQRLLEDDILAERLSAAGLEHAAQFTWETAAARHVEVYQDVLARADQ